MIHTTLYIATSKDGFIADKNGSLDWLSYAENDEGEDYGFAEFFNLVDYLVMGKKTFQDIAKMGDWPYEGVHTFVFSDEELPVESEDVSFFTGTPKEFIDNLPIESLVTRVWLVGGGELARSFEKDGLIDEYIITEIPVELKEGVSLGIDFSDANIQEAETKKFKKNIVQKHYTRV